MIEEALRFGMDGLPAHRPPTVQGGRQPIDIEQALWWALGQTGYLPWRGCSERELAFDHGYTVLPKGCSREFHGGATLLRRPIEPDAALVIEAVKALDPAIAAVVIACARERIRPDWMEGVEPRQVATTVYGHVRVGKRRKRRGRPARVVVWQPCDPGVIRAAREVYARWHAALAVLAHELRGQLNGFAINGFAAPAAPWAEALRNTA